jgi:hypothetical protein
MSPPLALNVERKSPQSPPRESLYLALCGRRGLCVLTSSILYRVRSTSCPRRRSPCGPCALLLSLLVSCPRRECACVPCIAPRFPREFDGCVTSLPLFQSPQRIERFCLIRPPFGRSQRRAFADHLVPNTLLYAGWLRNTGTARTVALQSTQQTLLTLRLTPGPPAPVRTHEPAISGDLVGSARGGVGTRRPFGDRTQ